MRPDNVKQVQEEKVDEKKEENGGKTSPTVNYIMSISYMLILPVISTSSPILMPSKKDSSSSSSWVHGEKKKAEKIKSDIAPCNLFVCYFIM